ncbi:hypothetical protein FHG87_016520 [Trinorchestia longiramus]|nr:hypothetical protein FHG87_016520 [Trinorchestia longiramus]
MIKEILCHVSLSLLLGSLSGPLDILITKAFQELPPKSMLRCWDSLYHGIIGAVSWGQFSGNYALNAVLAFLLSTVVDIDHVIPCLNSLQGENSTGQWRRGCFHYSVPFVIPSIISITIFLYKSLMACISKDPLLPTVIFSSPSTKPTPVPYVSISALVLVSTGSHHIRDAVRHGLWLNPIVTTAPLSSVQYSLATVMLPYLTAVVMGFIVQ